ncbi:SET domain-containing protein [Sistotremastrum suecicum HHB10207 ss-3]|uniref:SET domain-containing protein n=1 Tax=Sistotremastrum suecicum HHB10207 ss-3 TaxID=1314776 RepID=A0A166A2P3_9AGAM|nr:SET domain-containing protein [Sistotremastrum suecicum HHB10207 ss-3]
MLEKGLGIVAVKPIPKGTLILSEQALFKLDASASAEEIKDTLDSLSREEQREFLALTNTFRGEMKTLAGIFKTNALPCVPFKSRKKYARRCGIFPEASRFNHSCSPNVNYVWYDKQGQMRLYALRDIASGEELTIAYGKPVLATREERWKVIEADFGFRCDCLMCCREGRALDESNRRRNELRQRARANSFIFTDPAGAFDLLDREGLEYYIESFAFDAYQLCIELEMYEHARAYLQQAYDAAVVSMGEESEQVERLRAELEETESWSD